MDKKLKLDVTRLRELTPTAATHVLGGFCTQSAYSGTANTTAGKVCKSSV